MISNLKSWASEKKKTLKDDLIAGFIVAIVALPLAIGFAIASNVPITMGIMTAVIGGLFASAIGGSNYNVSGPSGTLVIIILSVVATQGLTGLMVATALAGIMLILLGVFRLGKIIEYIPSPVIIGFTAGMAVVIFASQITNFLGTAPIYPAGAGFLLKTWISLSSIVTANLAAIALAVITLAILILTPKFSKKIPGSIVAVIITTILVAAFATVFNVRTVGDIGKINLIFALPSLTPVTWQLIIAVLPAALTIAAIVAIESLLTAVVADGMTDTKHNPNKELIAQGTANIMSATFGGMPVSGATARTATNIRNGAKTRLAGMFHSIFLLVIILAFGALAVLIPLATLAGILMFVAYNMIEWDRVNMILKTPMSDVAVMITTFLITILVSITAAIEVGLILAAILFMKRMSDLYNIESMDANREDNPLAKQFMHPKISIYTINGPLFFGAASRLDQQLVSIPGGHKPIKIIRMKYVPVIDATGLSFIESTWKKHAKMGGKVYFTSCRPNIMRIIQASGLEEKIGEDAFVPTTKAAIILALRHAHHMNNEPELVTQEELDKYSLTQFDVEETQHSIMVEDKDPVQDILEKVGVASVHENASRGIKQAQKMGEDSVKKVGKTAKHGIKQTQKLGEEGFKTVTHTMTEIGDTGIKTAKKIGKSGLGTVSKIQKFGKDTFKKVTKKKKS